MAAKGFLWLGNYALKIITIFLFLSFIIRAEQLLLIGE